MAERIVDFFEGIDIDQGQVNRSVNGIAQFERGRQILLKASSISSAG
jgi:hypothetical protein